MKQDSYLYPKLNQLEVDFVIPLAIGDLPFCIDPFLLFKSRDPDLRALHRQIVSHFNRGMDALRSGDQRASETILSFPEVSEIGLGYSQGHKRGSGLGHRLRDLLVDTLKLSPAILERGIRHVEEMQLISAGIGPDRVGDISGNIIKQYLIDYTQRQARLHSISLVKDLPINHVYDADDDSWIDGYYDLPQNPLDGRPVIFVPRRVVRQLPWINYENFERTELRKFLASQRSNPRSKAKNPSKEVGSQIGRVHVQVIDNYVRAREQQSAEALPQDFGRSQDSQKIADELKRRLGALSAGRDDAAEYQRVVLDILTFAFCPDLIDGRIECRTFDGTERRDIIFTNDSDDTFFDYLRSSHGSLLIMFEAKNTDELRMDALNQASTYLGDRIGRFGCIVTRKPANENLRRKQMSVYNDSQPRKVILILSDDDLSELIDVRSSTAATAKWLQKRYREFCTSVQ